MRARDVMTNPVITVRPHVPARAAAALLVAHGFTSAPVVDAEGRLWGFATEADLMRGRIMPDGSVAEPAPDPVVADVMSAAPAGISPDTDLAEVVVTMLDTGNRSMPVIDRGHLVGIVTRRDVLRVVASGDLTSEDVFRRRHGSAATR